MLQKDLRAVSALNCAQVLRYYKISNLLQSLGLR